MIMQMKQMSKRKQLEKELEKAEENLRVRFEQYVAMRPDTADFVEHMSPL